MKQIYRILDDLSPSEAKLRNLPRKPDGLYNMNINEYGQVVKRKGYNKYNYTPLSITTVDADSAVAQKVLNVTSTTAFVAGDSVIINEGGDREEIKVIDTVQSGISLTMTEVLTFTHTAVQADTVDSPHKIIGMNRFYKQAATTSKEFIAACNTVLYKFSPTEIDVGSASIDRASLGPGDRTYIDLTNPANVTGKITNISIWATVSMTSAYVATFYYAGTAGHYTARSVSGNLGAVTACSAQNFTVDLDVVAGDYIGIYFPDDNCYIELSESGGGGIVHKVGDQTGCVDTLFTTCAGFAISLYATGIQYPYLGAAIPIKEGLTADKEMFFVDFYNHCYFVNGADGVFKYNMTNVRTVGITAPTAPTGVSNLNGSLTPGVYYYKITYVDEDGYESNGGAASAAITALADPNDGITLTIANSSDAKVVKRRIYRTTSGGAVDGIYYYEGEVADNTTETYNSITSDAIIGKNTVLHDDHDAPPTTSHLITKRSNRVYLADAEDLCISKLSDVEYFPAGWFIKTGNREKITGILEQVETLLVTTDDSTERLLYTDEDSFELKNYYSTKGNIALRSKVNCGNLLVFLDFEGLYYSDGLEIKELNVYLNEYIKANINQSYASLSAGCYFDNKYLFSYPKGVSTIPNETLYYDFRYHTYGIYSFAFGCYAKWDKGTDGLQLKGGSTTEGRIYSVLTGTTDDTAAITCYDSPEPIDLGKPDIWKQFYNIYIKVKSTTGTALRFYYTLDDASETYKDLTLTADTTRWYKIDLGGGGQWARAFKPRPYVSDVYDITYMGYAFIYEEEPPEYA